ncbi:MAG: type II secretion system minor pseudopilin GspK [Gallionella sp.]|nr:type II secretion system minor pseudopilin GspK [Gallionella sp.]
MAICRPMKAYCPPCSHIVMRQRGVALITAILIVALVASVATYLAAQNQVRIQQMENLKGRAQAELLARAAVDWGRAILADDAMRGVVDDTSELWATVVVPQQTDGGQVGGRIDDQQALFNLNNLMWGGAAYPVDVARFQRLLTTLQLPTELANGLVDWMDTDSVVTYPGGAEDGEYLQQEPPYRAGNRWLVDVDELYHVKGFNAKIIAQLRPFVTALPDRTAVNVNTASATVLAAILDNGSWSDANAIVLARQSRPIQDKQDLWKRFPNLPMQTTDASLDYGSRYFLVSSQAQYGTAVVREQALLQRNGMGWPKLLWIKQM